VQPWHDVGEKEEEEMKITRDFGLHFAIHEYDKKKPNKWWCLMCDGYTPFMWTHFPEGSLGYKLFARKKK